MRAPGTRAGRSPRAGARWCLRGSCHPPSRWANGAYLRPVRPERRPKADVEGHAERRPKAEVEGHARMSCPRSAALRLRPLRGLRSARTVGGGLSTLGSASTPPAARATLSANGWRVALSKRHSSPTSRPRTPPRFARPAVRECIVRRTWRVRYPATNHQGKCHGSCPGGGGFDWRCARRPVEGLLHGSGRLAVDGGAVRRGAAGHQRRARFEYAALPRTSSPTVRRSSCPKATGCCCSRTARSPASPPSRAATNGARTTSTRSRSSPATAWSTR